MQLFWHRRDLRVSDNRGLAAAVEAAPDRGPVVPLFVLDPPVLEHAAPPRVAFLLDALAALRERYRERGSDLLVLEGEATGLLADVAADLDAERVVWNEDYSGLARERDEAARAILEDDGVAAESHQDAVLHHPDSIRTNQGDPYSVYSYYWKKWRDREKAAPAPAPDAAALVDADRLGDLLDDADGGPDGLGRHDSLPTLEDLGFDEPEADVPDAGTDVARGLLGHFCAEDVYRYEAAREYPARDATSRLSPHLKFGTIGPREVWHATAEARADAGGNGGAEGGSAEDQSGDADGDGDADPAASVETFQSQLAWREFYTQVLYHHPEVVTENYSDYANPIEWREDETALRAWKDGETGYPIVDAGMRQLRAEAWMHNRVRMIVASFLTKDLLLDWREGYAWFREKLVDHDTGNDNGGWQWAASTGTDAQPYFRIFNPTTQGERYDPDAEYIRRYVPELRDVDPEAIHEWPDLGPERRAELAPDYPAPIVDHAERREQAIATFERARGDE